MHIPLQSGIDVGVTQNFAEGFGIKAVFHAAGGKGVTQGVKGKGIQPGPDQKALVFFQANAGLHVCPLTCEKVHILCHAVWL